MDTRSALHAIKDCITACNVYIRGGDVDCLLLRDVAAYITRIMKIFGAIYTEDDIGFPVNTGGTSNNVNKHFWFRSDS